MIRRARATGMLLGFAFALPVPAQTVPPPQPVALEPYLGTTATPVESGRWASRTLTINGERLSAWVTDVGASGSERVAAFSLDVIGFETFTATVTRDDAQTGRGPGLAYFEVWGDDKLLARSFAIGSQRRTVRAGAGAGLRVRRGSEQMEVSVRGVRHLRLVTRYASDIEQQAPQVSQARGCAWADMRLTPSVPTVAGGRPAQILDTVRDALRQGVVRLTTAAALATQEAEGTDAPLRLPLKTGIMPLRYEGRGQVGDAGESLVRAGLEELLGKARVQSRPGFSLLERREASRLAEARAEPDDFEALVAAGRRSGADLVISGVYARGQRIVLTATLVRTGKPLASVTVPIAAP